MALTEMSLIKPALVGTFSHRKKLKSAKREPLPSTDPSYTVWRIFNCGLSRERMALSYTKQEGLILCLES